jgi:hypothetical protein
MTTNQEKIELLRKASRELRQISAGPIPRDLGEQETKTAHEFFSWCQEAAGEMDGLANLMEATREMAEMNQSFNLQYLQLQQKMQGDNRQFTLMSNIMKVKHDTAKNAINNVR